MINDKDKSEKWICENIFSFNLKCVNQTVNHMFANIHVENSLVYSD